MSWQAVCTIAAIGFLCTLLLQLLPIDGVQKWTLRHYLVRRAVRWCKEVATRVDLHCLQLYQRHATLPLVFTAHDSAVAKNSLGTTRVKGFFGREVSVGIEEWNLCMCRRRAGALAAAARRNATRTVGALETRFLFSMQRDGLLLDLSLVVSSLVGRFTPRQLGWLTWLTFTNAEPDSEPHARDEGQPERRSL